MNTHFQVEIWTEDGNFWEPFGDEMFLKIEDAILYSRWNGMSEWRYRVVQVDRTVVYDSKTTT